MTNKNYWWLFVRNSETDVSNLGLGQEADISRFAPGTTSHKLLEDHYENAEVGDILLVSTFNNTGSNVELLGEITFKDDKILRFVKTRELKKPFNHVTINNDSLVCDDGVTDELGTLRPMKEETYKHIIENIIGEDKFTAEGISDGGQKAEDFQEEKADKLSDDQRPKKSPISPEMAQHISMYASYSEDKDPTINKDKYLSKEEYNAQINLIIKFVEVIDDKDKIIDLLRSLLD